jgi:hypothetical protein
VAQRDSKATQPLLGFLSILDHPQHGLTGGYLLLTLAGRPIEFHCSAPIKPTRAQQILFGPTLAPFLYGEHIGQALFAKGSGEPLMVFTDAAPALALGQLVASPVVLVIDAMPPDKASDVAGLRSITVGRNKLAAGKEVSENEIAQRLSALGEFDLAEPFERIRSAIEEAQRGPAAKAA